MEFVNPITVFFELVRGIFNIPVFHWALFIFFLVSCLSAMVRIFLGFDQVFLDDESSGEMPSKPKHRRPSREDVPWEGPV